jgi:hypothetical protein
MGWAWPGFLLAAMLALVLPARRRYKAAGVLAALVVPACWLATEAWSAHQSRQTYARARALFEARCRTAGVRIFRTIDEVEAVLLMKRRAPTANLANQYALTDPYGDDLGGDGYALSFLWGRDAEGHIEPMAPESLGYRYVVMANEDGLGYTRFELASGARDEGGVLPVLRSPAEKLPRYGVMWQDISTRHDRAHWIAGSRLIIVDTHSGELLAEHRLDVGRRHGRH